MSRKVTHYDLLEEKLKARDRELKLQAKEYERRLTVLNGEGTRIQEILKESIPREVFDKTMEGVNGKIQILTNFKNAQEGKSELTKYIPWAIAVISIALAYFKK
jgi:hypothetical protein